jgi:OOP family OmpA-OmpF porin
MKKLLITAAMMAAPVLGWAHETDDPQHSVYWHNSDGVYLHDSSGSCVKAVDWYEGSQIPGCDKIAAVPVEPMEADSDGDGVADSRDQCPNTPAGVLVDEQGCPLDTDRDRVADYRDKCPNTPLGQKVDEDGCKLKSQVLMKVDLDVHFAHNADQVEEGYAMDIRRVAEFMRKHSDTEVVLEGHTDSTGSDVYNKALSERRAAAVSSYMQSRYNIPAGRVRSVGYGESRPIADNDTAEGRRTNRRVVAVVQTKVMQ